MMINSLKGRDAVIVITILARGDTIMMSGEGVWEGISNRRIWN